MGGRAIAKYIRTQPYQAHDWIRRRNNSNLEKNGKRRITKTKIFSEESFALKDFKEKNFKLFRQKSKKPKRFPIFSYQSSLMTGRLECEYRLAATVFRFKISDSQSRETDKLKVSTLNRKKLPSKNFKQQNKTKIMLRLCLHQKWNHFRCVS